MGNGLYLGNDKRFFLGEDLDDVFGEDDENEMAGDREQIIGLEQILGALLGADRAPARRRRRGGSMGVDRNTLALLALAKQAGGAATRELPRNTNYEQPLPIPPTPFLAGQALDIELRPQRLCRIERLVFDSLVAPFFRILDLKVGQQTQFIASGAVPASIFSEVAVGMRLKGDTANLGNTVVLSLQNIDTVTRTAGGAIICTVIN
jgi:hypothetical protein